MWARVADDSIQEIINSPRIITIGGITHPRTMFTLWTDAERKAIGILPVTKASRLDSAYYIENNPSYAIESDGNSVTETITKSADRTLATVKSQQVSNAKRICNNLLASTDWYVTRHTETGVAIPADVTTAREAARSAIV